MLQSVHEHSQLLTRDVAAVAPASTGYAIGSLGTLAPWQSPAVLELRQGVGKREGAAPMMIEGRYGTALAAIGEPRDHKVAGRALGQAMTVQLQPTVKAGALGGPAALRVNTLHVNTLRVNTLRVNTLRVNTLRVNTLRVNTLRVVAAASP